MSDAERRRRERAERATEHRVAHDRQRELESERAQEIVNDFVSKALDAGLPAERLTARPWSGRGRYRTGLVGWYLRSDRSLGVSTDGGYYVLTVPPRRLGRWRTLTLTPRPPPLQVGEGARDGESVALDVLLRERLGR